MNGELHQFKSRLPDRVNYLGIGSMTMEKEMQKLLDMFEENRIEYQLYKHEPVYTSEQASKARGVELKTGVKSMVLRTKEDKYILANIAADRKIDIKKLERIVGTKELRFATKEEVMAITNCEPGSVHPFGRLFDIDTYLDESVLENDFVNFNIGMLTRSVKIRKDDLVRSLQSKVADFCKT